MMELLLWLFVFSFFRHLPLVANASGDVVSYKVIHPLKTDTQSMAIQLQNSSIYQLERSELDPILHVGSAPASMPYRYIVLEQQQTDLVIIDQEDFGRPATVESLHEFYNRRPLDQRQYHELPSSIFKQQKNSLKIIEDEDSKLCHPSNEIPTFHVQANPDDLRELYDNYLEDFAINATLSHISGRDFHHFKNVRFQLSGQTSRLFEKFSYSLHIAKEDGGLGGYRKFKLRASVTDPSFIREKLYYDVLAASGLPASRASYIRLFVNNEPLGLYVMVDNYKNPFLKNVFGGKSTRKYKHGVLYQGEIAENYTMPEMPSANLGWRGALSTDYIVENNQSLYRIRQESSNPREPPGLTRLIDFLEFIATNSTDEREWENQFYVDLFLKNMAFEVLMGHVDGYLGAAHNYFLYYEPLSKKLVWMTADLDQTMGNTMFEEKQQQQLDRYDLLQHDRPLFRQVMQVPAYKEQFNAILKDIHQGLFSDDSLLEHVNYLTELIKDDVSWDANIRTIRESAFNNDEVAQKYKRQIQQKILQLPLGSDLLARINAIDFQTALKGPITNHPSIMPLHDYISQAKQSLTNHIALY
ncbi:coth protein-domain-containing protein, partial [Fennellomyces sp. T-0311]